MIAAIGDIHGERWKLNALLRQFPPLEALVFLGDYVDRGPDIRGTLDRLIEIQKTRPEAIFLRGNHDQMMIDARAVFVSPESARMTKEDVGAWFSWGGAETAASYRAPGAPWFENVPTVHWEFLESTVIEHRIGPFIFVHAGLVPPDVVYGHPSPWRDEPRMWIRDDFIRSTHDFGGIVVFGHTVMQPRPLVMPNKIGIDTGAVFGGPLTAVLLDPERGEVIDFLSAT